MLLLFLWVRGQDPSDTRSDFQEPPPFSRLSKGIARGWYFRELWAGFEVVCICKGLELVL